MIGIGDDMPDKRLVEILKRAGYVRTSVGGYFEKDGIVPGFAVSNGVLQYLWFGASVQPVSLPVYRMCVSPLGDDDTILTNIKNAELELKVLML